MGLPSSGAGRSRAGNWHVVALSRRSGNLVGVAIIEAPTLYHARTRVAVRGIGRAADYSGERAR